MLHLLICAPFVAAILNAVGSAKDGVAATRTGVMLSTILAVFGIVAVASGSDSVSLPWFQLLGTDATVHLAFSGDGFGLWMVALVLILGPAALLGRASGLGYRLRDFSTAVFALQGCMIGAFLAADLVLFYFFFEAMLLPMIILIALYGDPVERRSASIKFFIYTMLGSAPMLVAIWYIASQVPRLALVDLALHMGTIPAEASFWFFATFSLAFA